MTWEQYQQQYMAIQHELQSHAKYLKQLANIEQQLTEHEAKYQQYTEQLRNEQATYEKLETRSILNFIRDFTGKRDELMKDNVERIAQIEAKQVETQLMQQELQKDVQQLQQKLSQIDTEKLQKQYDNIRYEMKEWLRINAPIVAQQITQITEEQQLSERLLVEIDEAIEAGLKAEEWLRVAAEKIRDADNYSTWDLLGGDFIATALKHSALEESNAAIHEVQIALQRFKNELLDIQEMRHEEMHVSVDGLVQFADYFLDDIFSDWMVHSKIGNAKEQIVNVLDDVVGTIHDLRMKIDVVEQKQQQLKEQKEAIFAQQIVQ